MKKIILFVVCLILLNGCVQKPPGPPAPPAPPTPVEGIPCTDSLDCPKQMKCEDSACIDVGCIEEGKTGPSAGINPDWLDHLPRECCGGLKSIKYSGSFDEDCQFRPLMGGPTAVCTKCGDGQCKEGETNCNCPEDCE